MDRTRRWAAAVLLAVAAIGIGGAATAPSAKMGEVACMVYLTGKATGSCTLIESGETGMAVGGIAAGVGGALAFTGVGAGFGGLLAAAGGLTAAVAG